MTQSQEEIDRITDEFEQHRYFDGPDPMEEPIEDEDEGLAACLSCGETMGHKPTCTWVAAVLAQEPTDEVPF